MREDQQKKRKHQQHAIDTIFLRESDQQSQTHIKLFYLHGARKEARHVDKGHNGDVKGIQEAHESGSLDGRINVQAAGKVTRVVGNNLKQKSGVLKKRKEDKERG